MQYIKKMLMDIYKIKWKIERKVIFEKGSIVFPSCIFEGGNRICRNVYLSNSMLGYGTYIGPESSIIASEIGRYTSIGPRVIITNGKHPTEVFVSTHPAFFSLRRQSGFTYVKEQKYSEELNRNRATGIGSDVWIGDSALILEGVKIGDGAIIAARSCVTMDIPPYAIVGGNPAKIIKYRFNKEQIMALIQIKWWEKDEEWIKERVDLFSNIDEFLKKNVD